MKNYLFSVDFPLMLQVTKFTTTQYYIIISMIMMGGGFNFRGLGCSARSAELGRDLKNCFFFSESKV